jgi:quercetin dioxygenase-like cupin family protein
MPIVRNAEAKFQQTVPGVRVRQLVNQEVGAGAITMGEAIIEPGSSLVPHIHRIEEAMFIVEGIASVVLGEETYSLETGGAMLVPAGVKHLLANPTQKPMRFVFFYPAVQPHRQVV